MRNSIGIDIFYPGPPPCVHGNSPMFALNGLSLGFVLSEQPSWAQCSAQEVPSQQRASGLLR